MLKKLMEVAKKVVNKVVEVVKDMFDKVQTKATEIIDNLKNDPHLIGKIGKAIPSICRFVCSFVFGAYVMHRHYECKAEEFYKTHEVFHRGVRYRSLNGRDRIEFIIDSNGHSVIHYENLKTGYKNYED